MYMFANLENSLVVILLCDQEYAHKYLHYEDREFDYHVYQEDNDCILVLHNGQPYDVYELAEEIIPYIRDLADDPFNAIFNIIDEQSKEYISVPENHLQSLLPDLNHGYALYKCNKFKHPFECGKLKRIL